MIKLMSYFPVNVWKQLHELRISENRELNTFIQSCYQLTKRWCFGQIILGSSILTEIDRYPRIV